MSLDSGVELARDGFVRVAGIADIPPGARTLIDLEEETIAIFNIDGELYCIADVCTHDGGPLADGDVRGCEIECPRHGARFDLRTGAALSLPAVIAVPTYEARVVGDAIYVKVPRNAW
ncbi:MAG: non-heme iron oxygenase ferredoxin subunit [Anaerolineales bacterium]|nr:non-heme iron oxygenase ferredoxin subunit [Anaerolineales bacterium]MCB8953765.1 non-heme iron oxygenase ferredoxin subunit [Ardenticatenales bacterium]